MGSILEYNGSKRGDSGGKTVKRFWLIIGLLTLLSLAACSAAGLVAENPEYAIIMKSKDNQYNEEVAESFRQVTEEAGYRCEVLYPESARAQDQVILVRRMMRERVKAIAIAVSDEHALAPVLKEAMAKGIVVTTLDSDTEKDSRSIYVSPADPKETGASLVHAVRDCMAGEGQWAILSTQARSANQSQWIRAMMEELEQLEYQNMRLVDIVYGEDDYKASEARTRELIEKYPALKAICAPTTVGIKAAADVVKEQGLEGQIRVTGLGIPPMSEGDAVSDGACVCPELNLWNPAALGELSAQVSMALVNQELTVREGAVFKTEDGRDYPIHEGAGGGLEVTAGDPASPDEGGSGL